LFTTFLLGRIIISVDNATAEWLYFPVVPLSGGACAAKLKGVLMLFEKRNVLNYVSKGTRLKLL
jgi:hypothetical protein